MPKKNMYGELKVFWLLPTLQRDSIPIKASRKRRSSFQFENQRRQENTFASRFKNLITITLEELKRIGVMGPVYFSYEGFMPSWLPDKMKASPGINYFEIVKAHGIIEYHWIMQATYVSSVQMEVMLKSALALLRRKLQ